MLSARAISQDGVGPSGCHQDEVNSNDIEVIYFEDAPDNTETEVLEDEFDAKSHSGEGMLLKNPRSSVKTEDINMWRYMYRIPLSVEIRVPTTHERVDWVVLG